MQPRWIVVAVDFSDESRNAFEAAASLAQDLDAAVLLVHAFQSVGLAPDPEQGHLGDPLADVQRELNLDDAIELSTTWAAELRERGLDVETVARHGKPEDVVLAEADRVGASLIVVGSHGWRGFRRLVLGSTAEAVMRRADRPVLVVKRPG